MYLRSHSYAVVASTKVYYLKHTSHPDSWTDYGGNHCNQPASSCACIATTYQCLRHKAKHYLLMCSPPAAGRLIIQTLVWHSMRLYSVWWGCSLVWWHRHSNRKLKHSLWFAAAIGNMQFSQHGRWAHPYPGISLTF